MSVTFEQYILYGKYVGVIIGFGLVFWIYIKYNYVRNSVGWKFIDSLGKVKTGLSGYDLVLRIKKSSGKEIYQPVKQSKIIDYIINEKGKDIKKAVIYDERAVDRLNGIPILTCTPNDIRPIDRETGLQIEIPPEVLDKLVTDSIKTAEGEQKKDKIIKMLVWALIGAVILSIIGISYINQSNGDLLMQLTTCYNDLSKSVTVIATK